LHTVFAPIFDDGNVRRTSPSDFVIHKKSFVINVIESFRH
jgi:hypothetical protein